MTRPFVLDDNDFDDEDMQALREELAQIRRRRASTVFGHIVWICIVFVFAVSVGIILLALAYGGVW
jgi:hypothetical protein